MHFLNASALWLLSLIPLIILFYLLKPKRRETIVPSSLLWQKAVESLQGSTPFRRLQKNLLMLLQILIIALLALALARPYVPAKAMIKGKVIFVIDTSASMNASAAQAKDESRLTKAKAAALDLIDSMSEKDLVLILQSAPTVQVVSSFTSDKTQLRDAIHRIRPTDSAYPIKNAVLLARSLARSSDGSEILVFTDGADPSIKDMSDTPGLPVLRYLIFNNGARNVGITAFDVRPGLCNPLDFQAFAAVRNFSKQAATVELELFHEGNLIDAKEVVLSADERRSLIFDSLNLQPGLLTLKINAPDDLAADNQAYAFVPQADGFRLLLLGERNMFIEEALKVHPLLKTIDYTVGPLPDPKSYDVMVCYDKVPQTLARGNYLVIHPTNSSNLFRVQKANDRRPIILGWDVSHPLMSHLDLSHISVSDVVPLEAASWIKPVVETASVPLILAGDSSQLRVVILAFDLLRSDLPLQSEFPMLMFNVLNWLKRADPAKSESSFPSGGVVGLPGDGKPIEITKPSGQRISLAGDASTVYFADTDEVGVYHVKTGAKNARFAVNLLNEAESNIAAVGETGRELGATSRARPGQGEILVEKEIWKYVGIGVLLLLLLEWWFYHKKIGSIPA
jgi:hypothetical protein